MASAVDFVSLTGGTLVAVLALLSPIGLPVHSPGVFGVDLCVLKTSSV